MDVVAAVEQGSVPSHIPPELVAEYPFLRGRTSTERPGDIAQRMQAERPPAFYAPVLFGYGGAWVFNRLADARKIAMDNDNFHKKSGMPFAAMTGGTWAMVPSEQNPPDHMLYRALVNPLFTPAAIARLDGKMRQYALDYVLGFKDRGHCEFISELAYEFPIRVFLELMDMPQARVAEFLAWETQLIHGTDIEEVTQATISVVNCLREEIAARRANPGDDFISFGIKAQFKGRDLNDDEMLGFCFGLFIGGLDTVSTHMGHFFRHLAEYPEDQAALRADPSKITDAIEELFRAYGAVTTMRICTNDIEIGGIQLRAGDQVAMSGPLLGRDPTEYSEPEKIKLDRRPKHMALGFGPHLCMGLHLARREIRIAMEVMLEQLPEFRIAPGAEIVYDLGGVVQPMTLPLVWDV